MKLLNRLVVVIRPKDPYIQWANSFDDDGPPFDRALADEDATTFLLPEGDDDREYEALLRRYFGTIFEHELSSWMRDEDSWPPDRSYALFREWFDVTFHSIVVDLVQAPLFVEEL